MEIHIHVGRQVAELPLRDRDSQEIIRAICEEAEDARHRRETDRVVDCRAETQETHHLI